MNVVVGVAAPAATFLTFFAGFLPALASLGQPIPLMLAAAIALACVSAEAAAPLATEPFPVATTAGRLTMTIPSPLTYVSEALANVWATITSFFRGPAANITVSSTVLDALGRGNIHIALRGIGSGLATVAIRTGEGIKALVMYVVKAVCTGVVQVYSGIEAAVTGGNTAGKGEKKAAGQVSGGAKRGVASFFGFGPKSEETLSMLQTVTICLRNCISNMCVWGKKAGLHGLYLLALLFLHGCDHLYFVIQAGHGLVFSFWCVIDFLGSGFNSFVAVGQGFFSAWGQTISSFLSVGHEVLSVWWKVIATVIVLVFGVVFLVTHVNVNTLHTQAVYFVLDKCNAVRRAAIITRRRCREFYARPDLKSMGLGDYGQECKDLFAEIFGRPYRMTVYQLMEFLRRATGEEVQRWMAIALMGEQLEVVEAILFYMRKVCYEGKYEQTEASQLLASQMCFDVVYKVLYDILVRQALTASAVEITQATQHLAAICSLLRKCGEHFVGIAILLEGVGIANEMKVRDKVTRQDWEKLRDSSMELVHLFPTVNQRRAFDPIFHWADMVREQLLTVASQEVQGAEAVEKGLVGACRLMTRMELLFV